MKQIKHLAVREKVYYGVIVVLMVCIGWLIVAHQAPSDVATVKQKVGKLIYLPQDEEPTLARVDDVSQLSDASLKKVARNNDELLIYVKNQILIVYRPAENKIVTVKSVSIDKAQAQADGATIQLLNGTADGQVADEIKKDIVDAYPKAVVTIEKASRSNYSTTIVIDNNDTKDELLVKLIEIIKAKRGVMPLGEVAPTTDMTIVIGQDAVTARRL